jgi:uncharacterized protein YigE (DUF2233 family)
MTVKQWPVIIAGVSVLLLSLVSCSQLVGDFSPLPDPTALPTATPTNAPTATSLAMTPDTGWEEVGPGLERRVVNLPGKLDGPGESLYLLRIDPALYRFDVSYSPGQPRSLAQWQADTGALIVVNGGFFTETYDATGLVIVAGQPSGTSYADFGGMLAITAAGPQLRWLPEQPYDPSEPLMAGLQSFPMLIRPGGIWGYTEKDEVAARRTAVGQDWQGRIVFVIASTGTLTLYELARYLAESDLELERALNLDGGASSGIFVARPAEAILSFVWLPTVIAVYPVE